MADEITISFQYQSTKGSEKELIAPGTISVDKSSIGGHGPVVIVGTSEENIPFGDVVVEGFLYLQNLDESNYVVWGPGDESDSEGGVMVPCGRLKPGEISFIRVEPGVTLRWVADTAACRVKMYLSEN